MQHAHTRPMQPHPVRFVDKAHVLLTNGWVVRGGSLSHASTSTRVTPPQAFARAPHLPTLVAPPPHTHTTPPSPALPVCHPLHSVEYNSLGDSAKAALRQAARPGLNIAF